MGAPASLEVEVRPPSPFRLGRGSTDRTLRVERGVATPAARPSTARRCSSAPGRAGRGGSPSAPRRSTRRAAHVPVRRRRARARRAASELATAIERLRFALGVDEDMAAFHQRFRRDPLVGPIIRRMPDFRPSRRLWPWEALAAAVCGQLIEASRAAVIERRIVGRWGARLGEGRAALRDVPPAALIAGRAPAELESMDLSGGRSVALRRLARDVAVGPLRHRLTGRRRAPPRHPADRPLDGPVPRPLRPRRNRLAARRRPRLHQAGRPPRRARPPRHRPRGRRVLRAVRALPRPGRLAHPVRPPPGRLRGPAAAASPELAPPDRATRIFELSITHPLHAIPARVYHSWPSNLWCRNLFRDIRSSAGLRCR